MVADGASPTASARSASAQSSPAPTSPLMIAPAVFAFGLVAFGFLGMGPVTIAVDSYGPVTDNAQSVYELSTIEQIPDIKAELKKDFGFDVDFEKRQAQPRGERRRRQHLQGDGQARAHRHGRRRRDDDDLLDHRGADGRADSRNLDKLSILHPPFLLGPDHRRRDDLLVHGRVDAGGHDRRLPRGRVHQGEHQARGRRPRRRSRTRRRSSRSARSTRRRACSTSSSSVFFGTLAFAFVEPFFFIGYLISIALFGLFQAIFMANAGGAWDNAKKIVEVELKAEGHAAARRDGRRRHGRRSVQGHVVGGDEPGHQVHDAVRPARRRAGGEHDARSRGRCSPTCWRRCSSRSRCSSCGGRSTGCGLGEDRPERPVFRPAGAWRSADGRSEAPADPFVPRPIWEGRCLSNREGFVDTVFWV